MGISISGSNAISGLGGNDTDFDKVLEQLKKIESTQLTRLQSWKSDWNLRYEAFTQIIEQVKAASSMLSQLSDKNNFVTKVVQSSNDNVITAVANASAQDVQHTINVKQTASNAIWCNGHVFDSKTDIINKTGTDQYFSYIYAGERHDFKVPPNTSLESFASMLNNSADNPGIKVSLIQTGKGYVFQVAGKDTGVENDLYIFNNNLEGMSAAGTTSNWVTNTKVDPSAILTDPTSYTFDLVLQGGATKSVTIKGNSTPQELATQLNNAAGGINARIDGDGNLVMDGVLSISRRTTSDKAYTPASTKISLPGEGSTKLNAAGNMAEGLADTDLLEFSVTMDDGSVRQVKVLAGSTLDDLAKALNQATGNSGSLGASGGQSTLTLSGVKDISVTNTSGTLTSANSLDLFKTTTTDAKGVRNELGSVLTDAKLELTFAADKLTDRLDGKNAGDPAEDIEFTILDKDGNSHTVTLSGNKTYQDLANELQTLGISSTVSTDADGTTKLVLDGAKEMYVSQGFLGKNAGYTSSLKATTQVAAANTRVELNFTSDTSARLDGLPAGDPTPGAPMQFAVTDKFGNTHTISIDSDKTLDDLLDEIGKIPGVSIQGGAGDSKVTINGIKAIDTVPAGSGLPYGGTATTTSDVANDLFYEDPISGQTTLEKAPDVKYTLITNDGKTGTLTLSSNTTMNQVLAALQNPGAVASDNLGYEWSWTELDDNGNEVAAAPPANLGVRFTDKDGNEYLKADGTAMTIAEIQADGGDIYLNLKDIQSLDGPQIKGQVDSSSNWSIQKATNAIYRVDNWPVDMESSSNTITDTIEGVVFTIQEVGEARLSVSTDITSVEQSIQNFLDAVNSVILTVNELMKYDETKQVTSNDPNDIGNDNYSQSGLTNQKGGLLTGNYGVQLFKSRFTSLLSTNPPGFKSQQNADDILSGDVLASLAQLGIKTDTDTTSDTYGLLVLAPSSTIAQLQTMDQENYTNMITNNLEAVVDFFCASGSGSSTSTDFRYGSHVEGITQPGVYDVTYEVDEDGNIFNVMIGGEPATRDESQPGNYFSVATGDPRGLSILIDDLTPGSHPPAGEPAMSVRIKQGLVQTTNNWLKAELVFNDVNISANSTPEQIQDAIYLKSQNGSLMSLRDNYMKVMESIDVKIEREQRRIDTWYNRQKQIFANLETLLAQYAQQQSSLEGQLKQLSGNS